MSTGNARIEGSTITASWSFSAQEAPSTFSVVVTERFTSDEVPAATVGPIAIERRDAPPLVEWAATIILKDPPASRAFRLRATSGAPIDLGIPVQGLVPTRSPVDEEHELAQLRAALDQQPDHGRAMLERLMPSADPDELRAEIDRALDSKAIWPFQGLTPAKVDDTALAAFLAAYPNIAPLAHAAVADQEFQTKEDWARYATAHGAAWFLIGGEVDPPLSLDFTPAEMSYDVREGELVDDSLTVALFSDNGNGRHASLSIAKQIVDSNLPYAFHLGDVYYGGTPDQFRDYFAGPLEPMLDRTELFLISGNHEMFGHGTEYNRMVRTKHADHEARQRQRAETFRLCGPGFQLIGLDTMFVGWRDGHVRLHDYADDDHLRLLDSWLSERPDDLTILMTTNEAWDFGSTSHTRLYDSLRATIAGRVDLWFWGNVHYAALYDPWPFTDTGSPARQVIPTCIGHGGYPFYTQTLGDKLPAGVNSRWLETRSRFWPEPKIRPDVGLNGWCRMKLSRATDRWTVNLTYLDWIGRERLRATLVREGTGSIRFDSVEESDIAAIGAPPTWREI